MDLKSLKTKLFARGEGKKRSAIFRYGWKAGLLLLVAAGILGVLFFYAGWAATFDM